MALTPGTRLGAYEIGAALGAGGTGEVYRAVDLALCGLDAWTPAVCRRPVTQRGAVAATTRLWRYSIGYREQMIGSLARTPLRVLANSFFLLEMTAAVEVYGGGERLISVMQADTVEAHYLSAWNAVLRGERGRALLHFECEWLAALDDFRTLARL